MSIINDENTIKEFVVENRDHLEEIEPDLLMMEKKSSNIPPEIINRIFRAIHSIKGSSGFLDFPAIKQLSHVMENVLVMIREGRHIPDAVEIDALLAGVDKLRIMFADILNSHKVPYQEELDRLNLILDSGTCEDQQAPEKQDQQSPPKTEPCPEQPLEKNPLPFTVYPKTGAGLGPAVFHEDSKDMIASALKAGQYIYAIWGIETKENENDRKNETLLKMETYGDVLARGRTESPPGLPVYLYGTVMELDLLCETLDLDSGNVSPLDPEAFYHSYNCESKTPATEITPKGLPDKNAAAFEENRLSYETIRVSVDLIDNLMNLAGELVLGRNQLRQELDEAAYKNPKLGILIQNVDVVTSEVQEKIMQMRMQPLGNLFNRFTRVVRDLAHQLSKDVDLLVEGQEVELDKSILEGLADPMTHLIRNSLDHGIESPGQRKLEGKSPTGTVSLKAFHEGGQVNIIVTDDGRGIDPDEIAEKAVLRRIISRENVQRMSVAEKRNLALMPGFSTAEEVSEISGRGVGMDVVRTNIENLGGHLELDSEKGEGTTVKIRLPLTLAIIPSLIVGSGGQKFAIPQINIKELVCLRAKDASSQIEAIAGEEVLRLREHLLPLTRLADLLGLERTFVHYGSGERVTDRRQRLVDRRALLTQADENETHEPPLERRNSEERRQSWRSDLYVVVLKVGENLFGLCVDELFDTEEIVVKPLSDHLKDVKCFAGATIMGDGRVAMILDASGIAEYQNLRFLEITSEAVRRRLEEASLHPEGSNKYLSFLLFNNSPDEQFAIPLEKISRIEKVDPEMIHRVGDSAFLNYRGESLPLIHLEEHLSVGPLPEDETERYVIVPKTETPRAGILVSQIQDTLETHLGLKEQHRQSGIMGSAYVEGRLTLFLNTDELLDIFENSKTARSGIKEDVAWVSGSL